MGLTIEFTSDSQVFDVEFKHNCAVSIEYEAGSTPFTDEEIKSLLTENCGEQEWTMGADGSCTEYDTADNKYHAFTRSLGRRLIIEDAKALGVHDTKGFDQASILVGTWSDGTGEIEYRPDGNCKISAHGRSVFGHWDLSDGILIILIRRIDFGEILELTQDEYRTKDIGGTTDGEIHIVQRVK